MTATQLTDREQQIRTLVADGLTNDDIAARLKISSRTVESHLRMLFRKLGVTRRDQVAPFGPPMEPEPDEVTVLRERLATYETAIRRIAHRQTPLFHERVEITLTIGETPAEDAVVERRWTTPKPYLIYRLTRPMLPPDDAPSQLSIPDLNVSGEVVGRDVGVVVQPIQGAYRHQMLVTFQPGLEEETEWVLRYRVPNFWDPLRTDGEDTMLWSPGFDERDYSTTSVTGVTVRFVFPDRTASMHVAEARGLGTIEETCAPDGRRVVVWQDLQPGGAQYRWRLKQVG